MTVRLYNTSVLLIMELDMKLRLCDGMTCLALCSLGVAAQAFAMDRDFKNWSMNDMRNKLHEVTKSELTSYAAKLDTLADHPDYTAAVNDFKKYKKNGKFSNGAAKPTNPPSGIDQQLADEIDNLDAARLKGGDSATVSKMDRILHKADSDTNLATLAAKLFVRKYDASAPVDTTPGYSKSNLAKDSKFQLCRKSDNSILCDLSNNIAIDLNSPDLKNKKANAWRCSVGGASSNTNSCLITRLVAQCAK